MSETLTAPASDRVVTAADNGAPDPFDAITAHIEDTLTEARNFADGTAIENQAQADAVSRLIDDLRKADKVADEARVKEAAPFNEEVAAIQARYNVYIAPLKNRTPGKIPLAIEALKKTLAPWLAAIEAESARKAAEARREAEAKAQAAADAVRAAQAASDLVAREKAEELVQEARAAETQANRAEATKAHATGGERAMGLKDHWVVKGVEDVTNEDGSVTRGQSALLRHYAVRRPDQLLEWLLDQAATDVRNGIRQIPGVRIENERRL